jgi:hypothetical protein
MAEYCENNKRAELLDLVDNHQLSNMIWHVVH